ncbi:MAG: hypothetical protein R3C40_05200 [Parvularculaceae bacterium]
MRSALLFSIAVAGLAACAQKSETQTETAAVTQAETSGTDEAAAADPQAAADACPVSDSRDWRAWLDVMPGPDAVAKLHITGEVDLPTPDYTAQWTPGPADRAFPPTQRFMLSFTPPGGMVTQVITPTRVSLEMDATYTSYREIIVGCGDEVLVEITDIAVAQ